MVIYAAINVCVLASPNILLLLTDDQDLLLKSLEFLPKIDKLLTNKGTTFINAVSFLELSTFRYQEED